jgi:hypothetical protein
MTLPDDDSRRTTSPKPKTRTTQTIVMPPKIVEDSMALITSLRARTTVSISRSKLLAILMKMIIRHQHHIDTAAIWDDQTLEQALVRAIARGAMDEDKKKSTT